MPEACEACECGAVLSVTRRFNLATFSYSALLILVTSLMLIQYHSYGRSPLVGYWWLLTGYGCWRVYCRFANPVNYYRNLEKWKPDGREDG